MNNVPRSNHIHINSLVPESRTITSVKDKIERKKVSPIQVVENNFTPSYPNFLPSKPQKIELINGNTIINKYIKKY